MRPLHSPGERRRPRVVTCRRGLYHLQPARAGAAAKNDKALRKPTNSPDAMPESRLEIRRPRRDSSPPSPVREQEPLHSALARVNEVNEFDAGGRTQQPHARSRVISSDPGSIHESRRRRLGGRGFRFGPALLAELVLFERLNLPAQFEFRSRREVLQIVLQVIRRRQSLAANRRLAADRTGADRRAPQHQQPGAGRKEVELHGTSHRFLVGCEEHWKKRMGNPGPLCGDPNSDHLQRSTTIGQYNRKLRSILTNWQNRRGRSFQKRHKSFI